MPGNRLFLSSAVLDGWILSGGADLLAGELRVRSGERYRVEEAVHVVAEVTGGGDAHRLVGRVRAVSELSALGAEVLDRSIVIGDLAYDVVPGFLAAPLDAPAVKTERATRVLLALADGPKTAPKTDEELLARYLMQRLE